MLGKLLKLDITFGWKKFLALAGAVILAGIILPYLGKVAVFGGSLLLIIGVVVIGALCVYTCVQYFRNNLFGSEGYLMFTLPVRSGSIVASKLLTTVLWFNVMFCAAGVALIFILKYSSKEFIDVFFVDGRWKDVLQMLLFGNMIGIPVIAAVYLAVSSRNITVRNRPLSGVIAVIIAVVCLWLAIRASIWGVDAYTMSGLCDSLMMKMKTPQGNEFMFVWMPQLIGFAISMVFTVVYGILTNLIIKKRLNLK